MHSANNDSDRHPLILLIEEEIQTLQELSSTLTAAGYAARSCSTAEEAIAATHEARPDLILCDAVVHERDGVEICERLQREARPGELPVMFLSGNQIPDIIRRRGALGGAYYLRKPCDPGVLLDLLEKSLGTKRQSIASER
ncbi:MAG: response regulator [Pirellulales bacterium]|nr:response regulator [Pirellulales bacterium]